MVISYQNRFYDTVTTGVNNAWILAYPSEKMIRKLRGERTRFTGSGVKRDRRPGLIQNPRQLYEEAIRSPAAQIPPDGRVNLPGSL
jgi:hypothetical protein